MNKTIHFTIGQTYIIKSLDHNKLMSNNLISMGLTPNQKIKILDSAPLGDPLIIKCNESVLAVRKKDFDCMELIKV